MNIEQAHIFVDISFLTSEEGGRMNMPIIKDVDYTYRPTLYLFKDHTIAYSCGMIIEKCREDIKPHVIMKSIPIILLRPNDVLPKIKLGDGIEFAEGTHIVARGIIRSIKT